MKKVLAALLACLTLLGMTACQKKVTEDITTVTVSEETAAVRDAIFRRQNILGKEEIEVFLDALDEELPELAAREGQTFPDVKTEHRQEVIHGELGDTYTLTGDKADKLVLFIHGGGWVSELTSLHVIFCDRLVDLLGAKVYMPLYPLAPQATYREGYAMLEALYDELLKEGKPIILIGDSAGANIATGLTLMLKEKGKQLPCKLVTFSVCADISFSNPEMEEYTKVDGLLSPTDCAARGSLWCDGEDTTNPILSPLYGDYKNFPDTLMFMGTCEILYPDCRTLYSKMIEAGVKAKLVIGEGFWHVFPLFEVKEQEQFLGIIKDFCQ